MMTEKAARWLDCLRGAMWEEQYRGRLEEHRSPDLLAVSALKWEAELMDQPVDNFAFALPLPWNLQTRVGLGTYKWKYRPDVIEEAIHLGVPLIDTAESYGYGKVEKELGKVFRSLGKEWEGSPTWIASKVARNHLSRNACVSAGLRSRDNLQVESIDLNQIHWPVMDKLEATLDAMAELREKKVIRRVGVSNFSAGQLLRAYRGASERGFVIESNQIRLNPDDQGNRSYLLPFCDRMGVRVLAYSPLAQGLLGASAIEALTWGLALPERPILVPATNNVQHLRKNLEVGLRRAIEERKKKPRRNTPG